MVFEDEQSQFFEEYLQLMELSYNQINIYPHTMKKPSYLNLSTMTIVCDLSESIDILCLSDNFITPSEYQCIIKRPKPNKEFDISKRGKKKKTFYNQASIHYTDHTTKCIKVFSNGKLHITGVTSVSEASTVCLLTCGILNKTIGAVVGSAKIKPLNIQICMINTNFSINHGLNIIKLKDILKGKENITCSYTPDTYPGLKIKFTHENKNRTSLFIFSSGQIVITGVKLMIDIHEVYLKFMNILHESYEVIYNPNIPIKNKKKKYDIKYGYDLNILQPCLTIK